MVDNDKFEGKCGICYKILKRKNKKLCGVCRKRKVLERKANARGQSKKSILGD